MGVTLGMTRGHKKKPKTWHKDDGNGHPLCMPSRFFGRTNVTLNNNCVTCEKCMEMLKAEVKDEN